ncbi:hypothetical protein O6268_23655, partial [Salmonella enterica subsp. enterica]
LDSRSANWCAAVGEAGGETAIAAADVSTGRFEILECSADAAGAALAQLNAAEVIAPDTSDLPPATGYRPKSEFDSAAGEARLKKLFGV